MIEQKSFELRDSYVGNSKILRITERRKAFSAYISVNVGPLSWICEGFEQAGRVLGFSSFLRS